MLAFGAVTMVVAHEPSQTQLTISNVRVFTGERSIERAIIAVESGKIVSISADAPAARSLTIDGAGMTALPGLIDAHVHLQAGMDDAEALAFTEGGLQKTLQAYLRHGVTTVESLADPIELIRSTRTITSTTRRRRRHFSLPPAIRTDSRSRFSASRRISSGL